MARNTTRKLNKIDEVSTAGFEDWEGVGDGCCDTEGLMAVMDDIVGYRS